MRILTWNLFHGRAVPGAGRDLYPEFAAALAGWRWDVALLQEVPPWWPAHLGRACGASARTALTSRNALLPLRRRIAERAPDLIKANGGGANVILMRGAVVAEHRRAILRRWPEQRVVHAVRLAGQGWFANLHAQANAPRRARADISVAGQAVLGWAAGAPLVLGGDFNVRDPAVPTLTHLGGHGIDHVLGRGLGAVRAVERPERGRLSDHAAVIVEVA